METRNCQNCKNSFNIEIDDFSFYQKMGVPAPTWCPECRMVRRLAFGNAWGVHFRNCNKCGDRVLTMYNPEDPTIVYCDPCWWKDDWDGTEYGIDYDPNRTFLEQWRELRMRTPHFAKDSLYTSLKNCEYTNAIAFSKDCYMSFWADYCDFVYYSSFLNNVKDSLDSFRVLKSELLYESVGINNSSRVYFSMECDSCVDVWFSRNCYGCTNCIGCVNQRGANYKIFNQQYTKEDYLNKIKEFGIDTRSGLNETLSKANDFWKSLPYREYTGNSQNLNVSGDYIYESKNASHCYMCTSIEDSKYCQFISVPKASNCMDYYGWGNGAELIYECATSGEGISSLKFSFGMFANGLNSEYCGFCIGSKSNFGCVNLKRKEYCILNKQYTKEEYQKLKAIIIQDTIDHPFIDSKGREYKYGEFFPPEFSPFPWLDSNASRFFEKDKDQAITEGYNWFDKTDSNYTKTISGNDLPEKILDTPDSIIEEVIECVDCFKCYKISMGELTLYRKLNIPISNKCPKCREKRRFGLINKPKMNDSFCDNCGKGIKTMHDLNSEKIIYCESCYLSAIV